MHRHASLSLVSLLRLSATALAQINKNACPLIGSTFPVDDNLNSATLKPAADAFTASVNAALAAGVEFDAHNVSFSINVWNTAQDTPLYEYHYEGTNLVGDVSGGGKLNGDTLYRIGSISKLHTVYTYLAAVGERHLDEPVTRFIPELAAIDAGRNETGAGDRIRWGDITLRSLAAQLSGLPRDYGLGDVFGFLLGDEFIASLGLPPSNTVPRPLCYPFVAGHNGTCTREEFFDGISQRSPVWTPYRGPNYSNVNYGILAYALEGIVNDGRRFPQIFRDVLIQPLGLNRTFYELENTTQPIDNAMIPYDVETAEWLLDGWFDDPAGAHYSSANDLAALGQSILRSDLVSKPITNHWLKPLTFTSDPDTSVGMPWEIYRAAVPVSPGSSSTRLVDLYTKGGDVGLYATMLAIVPDYEMGFTVLVAGDGRLRSTQRVALTEKLRDHFLPVLEQLNGQAAERNFAGDYKDDATNSSLTIALSQDLPGLSVTQWVSRGVDMLAENSTFRGDVHGAPTGRFAAQLQPTANRAQAGKISFRMVVSSDAFPEGNLWECLNWASVDSLTYGLQALDHFVFDVAQAGTGVGQAQSVELRGFRSILSKVS